MMRKVIFESPVRWVSFDEKTKMFTVTVMNHKTGKQETAYEEIYFQAGYIRDLTNATNYPEFQVEKQGEIFKEWKRDKKGILWLE